MYLGGENPSDYGSTPTDEMKPPTFPNESSTPIIDNPTIDLPVDGPSNPTTGTKPTSTFEPEIDGETFIIQTFEEAKNEYMTLYPDFQCDPWSDFVLYGRYNSRIWPGQLRPIPKTFQEAEEDYLSRYSILKQNYTDPWPHYVLYGKKMCNTWLGPERAIPKTFEEAKADYVSRYGLQVPHLYCKSGS